MKKQTAQAVKTYTLELGGLQQLFDVLNKNGYKVVGPTYRDGVIVLDELTSADELPIGWTDEQDAATYRVEKRNDAARFGYAVGQQSWKKFLHPTPVNLWETKRKGSGFQLVTGNGEVPKYAFVGVRPCELRAIAIQDNVFVNGNYVDRVYNALRKNAFILAVNCTEPSGTCFCTSMETGPKAESGFDIILTEIIDSNRHYFVAEPGSEIGGNIIDQVPHDNATEGDVQTAEALISKASSKMGRSLDTLGLKELLYSNYEHPQWDDVANRCLSCGNCTMVCPTCFCNTVEDYTDLKGENALRHRKWDSCYNMDFTYIHGGSTRPSPKSRYRQWLTHKLATWEDQFGTLGCVGCGRCITWCPAAIDITEEAHAIRGVETVCKTCVPSKEKAVETMKRILADHPFIKAIGEQYLDFIAEYSAIVRFNAGEFIFHAGEDAERFYLLRHGKVAIETFTPDRGTVIVQTIGEGDLLGWSWFVHPYKWHFDALAIELTRAVAVDAKYIRDKCDKDSNFGYLVNQFISQIIGQRMEATRMQLLDIYGDHA